MGLRPRGMGINCLVALDREAWHNEYPLAVLPGMRQGGPGACDELHAAQALAHTFNARLILPATSRGSAVVEVAHDFGSSFAGRRRDAGPFTAAGKVHAKVRKPLLLQLQQF